MSDAPGTETPQLRPTIAGTAGLCLQAFQRCLELARAVGPRELSLVEDQLARLSVWTASIGVFAQRRASMDHRLREVPDVLYIVVGILDTLRDYVEDCSSVLEIMGGSPQGQTRDASAEGNGSLDRPLRGVTGEISLLYKLSNTIRRASKESQNLKAAKLFRIKDDEGNDAGPALKQIFARYLAGRFPGIPDLCERLASTMLLRRKRILYRRSRYEETPIRTKKTIPQPKVQLPVVKNQPADGQEHAAAPTMNANAAAAQPAKSVVKSLAPSATTLAANDYKKASAPSTISVTRTIALGNHEALAFPPAPVGPIKQRYRKLKKQRQNEYKEFLSHLPDYALYVEHDRKPPLGPDALSKLEGDISKAEAKLRTTLKADWDNCARAVTEFTCPFCLYALPGLYLIDDKKWNAHVIGDLDAYVCLFDECDKPEELYAHSRDWMNHMREHALRWRCNSKSHGALVFQTRNDYLDHMKGAHGGSFTEAQLGVLADRSARMTGPMFEACPFCTTEVDKDRLEDHIVGHLRSVALKSLPPYEGEELESSEEGEGSLGTARRTSRTTVRNDPERHSPLFFLDDNSSNPWRLDGDEDEAAKHPYLAWGGFYNYISRFPNGLTETGSQDGDPHDPPTHFPAPPILADGAWVSWQPDPSAFPSEESVFTARLDEDMRRRQWGFISVADSASPDDLEDDSIIQSLLKQRRGNSSRETTEPALPGRDSHPTVPPSTTLGLVVFRDQPEGITVQDLEQVLGAFGDVFSISMEEHSRTATVDFVKRDGLEKAIAAQLVPIASSFLWVKEVDQEVLAEDHPDQLALQRKIAVSYQEDGQMKKAIELLEHVVEVEERTLAEDNPRRLDSQLSLAQAYQEDGQLEKAVKLLQHVVATYERVLAEDQHPLRLDSNFKLVESANRLLEHIERQRQESERLPIPALRGAETTEMVEEAEPEAESLSLDIALHPDEDADANFRVRNSWGEFQGPIIHDDRNSPSATVVLRSVLHGILAEEDGTPATLLVFAFRFVNTRASRRFTRGSVTLKFRATSNAAHDPQVDKIEPLGQFRLDMGRKGELPATETTLTRTTVKGESTDSAMLTGMTRLVDRDYGPNNAARWDLQENRSTKAGIPGFLQTAVLLQRENDEPFHVQVGIDTAGDMASKVRAFFGSRSSKSDPMVINPRMPGVHPKGESFDQSNMERIDLSSLVAIHMVEPIPGPSN